MYIKSRALGSISPQSYIFHSKFNFLIGSQSHPVNFSSLGTFIKISDCTLQQTTPRLMEYLWCSGLFLNERFLSCLFAPVFQVSCKPLVTYRLHSSNNNLALFAHDGITLYLHNMVMILFPSYANNARSFV